MPSLVRVEAAQSWATSLPPQQKPAQAMGREVEARRAVKKAKTRGWVVGEAVVEKEADKAGESVHAWEASIYGGGGGGGKQLAACFRWIGDGGEDLRDGK